LRILLSGSHGLIGSALTSFLADHGHRVVRLLREKQVTDDEVVIWDPLERKVKIEELEGFEAVIHLAGENVASGRWTTKKKQAIYDSRIQSTQFLCECFKKLSSPPKDFICASAIGFYGHRKEEELDEKQGSGNGFLSNVCKDWEAVSEVLNDYPIRVAHLRFGVVLSSDGGALAQMLRPFRMGFGGRVGSGEQYMSWIAIDDAISALYFVLRHNEMTGPVNIVSPNPVTNLEFTKILGQTLGKWAIVPLPAFLARIAMGELANELLLASTRAIPAKLMESEFSFQFPNLADALEHVIEEEEILEETPVA
jgi:uncharacterized protein (TIGR01777 family)